MKFLVFFALLFISIFLHAADIKYDSPQTFYAGRETTINIKTDGLSGRNLSWNVKYSGLSIAAAELVIPETGIVELKFTFPEIKDGVTATAELTCLAADRKLTKNIVFFSTNPFSFKKKNVEKMKIGLWAPSGDDTAKKIFESLGVVTADVANFADFKDKCLIVSGIDFGNFSGLEKDFNNICSAGSTVFIINPSRGVFPLKTESMKNMIFSRNDKIMDFDKKFDVDKWGDSPPNEKSFNLVAVDNGAGIEVVSNRNGFTFISAKIGKGELVICSWGIFLRTDKSPTPIYLLDKLMSESEKRKTNETEKEPKKTVNQE